MIIDRITFIDALQSSMTLEYTPFGSGWTYHSQCGQGVDKHLLY